MSNCHCGPCPVHKEDDIMLMSRLDFDGHIMIITSVNLQTNEGTFRYFKSNQEANDWHHEMSKSQLPTWHLIHCPKCRGEKAVDAAWERNR